MITRPSRDGVLSRPRALALGAVPLAALLAVGGLAPLPYSVARPGQTTNVLGVHGGAEVISISGAPVRETTGQLRMTAIVATAPRAEIRLGDVIDGWFRTDRAVMPKDAVFPSGMSDAEIAKHNRADMTASQDAATAAALGYLKKDPDRVRVKLKLSDVGGPSAGLLFSLGIVDKLAGDGSGGDLTGGRKIAGTGTIDADGTVGAVGGVALKTQAAKRDGASVFLVPKAECSNAQSAPDGLRLIPVTTLKSAVQALRALAKGGSVPSC
ncbi:S16 family serine protease [Streptomyces sp. NPDC050636]|uniref:S16 family serine protease n=1 Tax=Streptomyces sp. NPDC050636 TaxID=3154510 RepID=UPI0034389B41